MSDHPLELTPERLMAMSKAYQENKDKVEELSKELVETYREANRLRDALDMLWQECSDMRYHLSHTTQAAVLGALKK